MKKNNQKYSIFKVVCIALAVVIILTWVFKTMKMNDLGTEIEKLTTRSELGLFDLFNYLTSIPQAFGYIPLYILKSLENPIYLNHIGLLIKHHIY